MKHITSGQGSRKIKNSATEKQLRVKFQPHYNCDVRTDINVNVICSCGLNPCTTALLHRDRMKNCKHGGECIFFVCTPMVGVSMNSIQYNIKGREIDSNFIKQYLRSQIFKTTIPLKTADRGFYYCFQNKNACDYILIELESHFHKRRNFDELNS